EDTQRPCDVAAWRNALLGATEPVRDATPSSVGVRAVRVEPYVPTGVLKVDAVRMATTRLTTSPAATIPLDSIALETLTEVAAARSTSWNRLFGYLLLMVECAALGTLMAKLPAFQEARIMQGKLNAALLPQLLGVSGVIAFFWMFARALA